MKILIAIAGISTRPKNKRKKLGFKFLKYNALPLC
jgi:hypothetical protein